MGLALSYPVENPSHSLRSLQSLNTDLGVRLGPCTCPECLMPPGCIARVIGIVPGTSRGVFEGGRSCILCEQNDRSHSSGLD